MSKPKVLISTDLGGSDKDDAQSLIHALLYADKVDYRGIVATLTDDAGANPSSHWGRIADAYGADLSKLQQYGDYPSASEIRSLLEMGSRDAGWPGKLSDGAKLIIEEARDASSSDPLYLLAFGPVHDIARALYEAPDIAQNVRILSIAGYGQDTDHPQAYNWMRQAVADTDAYKGLWWVDSAETFRGMYVGSNGQNEPSLNLDWVKQNVDGHGALGNLFHDVYTKDLFGPGSVDGLKMGDTPSLLYLLDNANNDNPGASSWGGSFQKNGLGPNTWSDKAGEALGSYDGARTVYEHRSEAWGDFAQRLDRLKGSAPTSPDEVVTLDPAPAPRPAPAPSHDGASIDTGLTEIETLDLSGYRHESRGASSGGANVATNGSGSAAGVFDGVAGNYRITVGYLDEDDGAADWRLVVNGKTVDSWSGTADSHGEERISVDMSLDAGDAIRIEGTSGGGEQARLDWMRIDQLGSAPAPTPKPAPEVVTLDPAPAPRPAPAPSHDGASIDTGLTEIETLDLSGYRHESRGASSGGANVATNGSGSAAGVFDGGSGNYRITVGYLDEDDGAADWRLVVNGKTVDSWSGTADSHGEERISVDLSLDAGDAIRIEGTSGGGEQARLDWMRIDQIGSASAPTPSPTPAPAPAPQPGSTAAPDADLFVFAGQSNAAGHFFHRSGDSSGHALGNDVFERAIEDQTGKDVSVVNAAVSGSGSNQYSDSSHYWWNVDTNKPGPELVRAMSIMRQAEASGRDVDGLIWAQGEDDAHVVRDDGSNLAITTQRFDEATRATFDYIRSSLGDPDLPIFIQELGNFPEDGGWLDGPSGALSAMRGVQSNIIRSEADVHLGARTTDVDSHYDAIHFDNAGYGMIAERLADTVADEFLL